MKSVFLVLVLITASFTASALTQKQCEKTGFALTKETLVIAKDRATDGVYATQSAHMVWDDVQFNKLRDSSCLFLDFYNDKVLCIGNGERTFVGTISNRVAQSSEWNFYEVKWESNVVVKAGVNNEGCVYGMAVQ